MSFEIDITVDPSKALPGIAKVETSLAKVEVAGPRVGAAVTRGMREGAAAASSAAGSVGNFGEALARVAKYEKILAGEAAQAKAAVGNLANAFGQLATHLRGEALKGASKAFAGLTEQLQREAAVLERIRGPMREHMADLNSLAMMYRKGTISAAEYHAEQARMGAGPGVKGGGPGGLAGGLGGIGTKVAAAAGVAYGAKQVLDLADAYTGLENRLRQVTNGESELAAMMTKTREIANGARMEWGAVGESFVRLTGATQNLGLSQGQVLNLTDNLSKTIQLSGATSSEAAAGMLQLSQAFASGRLQGDEFRSVSENLPIVMQMLSKELGVSRGELKKMASEGKITSDILARTFLGGDAAIEAAFGKTTATAAQQWTVFKNELTATAGELVKSSKIVPVLGAALQAVMEIVGPLAAGLGAIVGGIAAVAGAARDAAGAMGVDLKLGLGTVAGMIVGGPLGAALGTLAEGLLRRAIDSSGDFGDELERVRKQAELAAAGMGPMPLLFNEMADAIEEAADQLNRLQIIAKKEKSLSFDAVGGIIDAAGRANERIGMILDDPWGESGFEKGLSSLAKEHKRAAEAAKVHAAAIVLLGGDADSTGRALRNMMSAHSMSIDNRLTQAAELAASTSGKPYDFQAYGGLGYRGDGGLGVAAGDGTSLDRELNGQRGAGQKSWLRMDMPGKVIAKHEKQEALTESLQRQQEALNALENAAKMAGDALVDAFMGADVSAKELLRTIAMMLAKQALGSLIGAGFNAISPTALSMPAAAVGGSWTVGGSGGTDSQVAMLRVTPRERITVDTPGQMDQAEGRRSGGGGRKMVTVQQPDGSRARFLTEDDFEELFITMTDRHAPALRSRLTGR